MISIEKLDEVLGPAFGGDTSEDAVVCRYTMIALARKLNEAMSIPTTRAMLGEKRMDAILRMRKKVEEL